MMRTTRALNALGVALPLAHVPVDLDHIADGWRRCRPAGAAAAGGDVEADGVHAATLREHVALDDPDEHGGVVHGAR